MSTDGSQAAIADRIRGIIGPINRDTLEMVARGMGVSELSLRLSIDVEEPHPTLEVIGAIIRHYGVDPSWLITGTYDPMTHRAAVDHEPTEIKRAVADILAKWPTPIDTPRQLLDSLSSPSELEA